MLNNILNFQIITFSALIAFGELDPILPLISPFSSIDLIFISFAVLFVLFHPKSLLKGLISFNFISLLAIILLFAFAQSIFGYDNLIKPFINFKLLSCIIFFLVVSITFAKNPKLIEYCLLAFSISCFAFSILVLLIDPNLYVIYKGQLIVMEENPNSTSSRLVIGAIYLIYLILNNPLKISNFKKICLLIMIPIIVYMVVLSGSRGSLLALIIGIFLILTFSKIHNIFKISLLLISSFTAILLFNFLISSNDLGDRWQSALEGDTAGRTEIWSSVFEIVKGHPLGVGESGYAITISKYIGKYLDTHNIFLYILVCGGWLSLLIFNLFLLNILKKSIKTYRNSGDILGLLLFSIIIFIASKTGGAITYLLFWFILAITYTFKGGVYER